MTADLAAVVDKSEGLLTIGHAADWLDVSYATVGRLIAGGQLIAIRVAGHRRIDVDELRAFVARQKAAATPTRRARAAS